MEIGIKVLTEHYTTGETTHILSAYFTFVAVDSSLRPVEVPQVIPETSVEKRRYEEAEMRRQRRKKEKEERIKRRKDLGF
jgi:acyl-CoA hydrolase